MYGKNSGKRIVWNYASACLEFLSSLLRIVASDSSSTSQCGLSSYEQDLWQFQCLVRLYIGIEILLWSDYKFLECQELGYLA